METISFARGGPAPELLPLEELADCARTVLGREGRSLLSYGDGAGYAPLRELVGEWFGVHPGRVVLTNGALHGLELLARLIASGQTVLCETPTSDRAYQVLLAAGAAIVVAQVEEQGLDPVSTEVALVGQRPPVLLYVNPTFHNPTGTTMTAERRRTLVALASQARFAIVEDDPYRLLRFEGEPVPPLFDVSRKTSVYLSSFSATIAPGLRVGFLILGERLAERVAAAATDTYITPALLSQAIVHEFIRRGRFEPNLRRVNEQLRLRRDAMLAALEKHFAGARWTRPEGGYFLWLELPPPTDAREVLARAHGVTAVAGTAFTATASCLRLAYGSASPDEIEEGIARLAAAV